MGSAMGHVMTLANSIIGVSILAMPFCFKQCGIILSVLLLLFSNIITRCCCHFLIKSAHLARRRNYEFLAFHTFGPTGKLVVELSIIGFLLGTCIAFFVVIGDLGPDILAKAFNIDNSPTLRPSVLVVLAICVILPLGLLRNVDSLSVICTASILFYLCLVLKVISEAMPHLLAADWLDHVNLWRPAGILQCIPIFSMALSCQTQVFEIYDSLPDASPLRMNEIVRAAVNMCTGVYICVGFFGYVAFCTASFTGNVMLSFSPSMVTDVMKLGFVLSLAVSFPLVIFPCRASLYSLLFKRASSWHPEVVSGPTHIPEARFKCITLFLVTVSLMVGLLLPNIELVLGLVGSTIGTIICLLLPALMFTRLAQRYSSERLLAQVIFFIAAGILILSTYANLYAADKATAGEMSAVVSFKPPELKKAMPPIELTNINQPQIVLGKGVIGDFKEPAKSSVEIIKQDLDSKLNKKPEVVIKPDDSIRVEPPIPQEPKEPIEQVPKKVEEPEKNQQPALDADKADNLKPNAVVVEPPEVKKVDLPASSIQAQVGNELKVSSIDEKKPAEAKSSIAPDVKAIEKPHEQVAVEAIMKDEKERAEEEPKHADAAAEAKLLEKLAEHEQKQKKLLEEQQQIRKEMEEHKKDSADLVKPEPTKGAEQVKVQAINAVDSKAPVENAPKVELKGEEKRTADAIPVDSQQSAEDKHKIGQLVDGLQKLTNELKESIAEIKKQKDDVVQNKAKAKPLGALLQAKKLTPVVKGAENEVLKNRIKREAEAEMSAASNSVPAPSITGLKSDKTSPPVIKDDSTNSNHSSVELKLPQQLTVSEVKLDAAHNQINSDAISLFDVKPITRDLKTVEEELE
ncbi:putative sodium-coupled neutral amino acid transporter 10 [Cloeon dipterum]|uniref:putative sodium-coupled neutral amino acid transporter 10 n=1 Tax=Cloeon dipterum TaxID=197152 RepID=UPI0032207F87